jgi:hypothetical protein
VYPLISRHAVAALVFEELRQGSVSRIEPAEELVARRSWT